jgi:EAL domain-containing protein (putative c-di-GMP-specific phosphodiesterase class I)
MVHVSTCSGCKDGSHLSFDITMAFQPIFDMRTGAPWAFEALVRGLDGSGAAAVLDRVTPQNRYAFDQRCRVVAIQQAVAAGLLETSAKLSINFLPNAIYNPQACIQLTLRTARAVGLPFDRLIFEFTENERMADPEHIMNVVRSYRKMGFLTAIDDFGAGYAGLSLLTRFKPDLIKLDMELIRGIDADAARQKIVDAMVMLADSLGMDVVAEGIETVAELTMVRSLGIHLVQGYLLARPAIGQLPALAAAAAAA